MRLFAAALLLAAAAIAEEGPFDARMGDHKSPLTAGGGSTGKGSTEEAVLAGLTWLARHQSADGRWSTRTFTEQCLKEAPCGGVCQYADDAGITALVLLAFAGAGKTDLEKEEYADPVTGKTMCWGKTVQKGLEWLMEAQDAAGCFGGRAGTKYMYTHLCGAAAMAEFYAMTESPVFEKSARAGLEYTIQGQNPGAGWRYSSKCGDSDTSATAWGVTALMAARAAGIEFDKKHFVDAFAWVDSATDGQTFKTGYNAKGTGKVVVQGVNEDYSDHPTMTAAALVIRLGAGEKKTSPKVAGAGKVLLGDLPRNEKLKIDSYYWYYGTEAMFLLDGPKGGSWAQWNAAMKTALLSSQAGEKEKDICLRGSWDPEVDRWGFEGGRCLPTALNVLTLEIYYRVRPAYVKGH